MSAVEASSPRRRTAPLLERLAFRTSPLAEFCSIQELAKQTGRPADEWPLVILKELVDNSLDAAEEREIEPEILIEVSTETGEIIITDNGPGLAAETITGILDYNIRVSSREAYCSPSRGQQGNALKCIVAMPFALDGERGVTIIESRGQAHTIVFEIDRVRREPRIERTEAASNREIGSRITVRWPVSACHLLEEAKAHFLQLAGDFTTFNPHLTLRCQWDDIEVVHVEATNPGWQKWRTCDFTSAHWYDRSSFERYIAAHLNRDREQGGAGRTVRHFIEELRGLRWPGAQKVVLAATNSSRVTLEDYFAWGETAIAQLLRACQRQTDPVKPKHLGLIGRQHMLEDCLKLGAEPASFKYSRHLDETHAGLPYVLEVAFAWCPEATERRLIAGTNFSIALSNPFSRLGYFGDLSSLLTRQYAGRDAPVIVVAHYVCPAVEFADHGKTTLTLPYEVGKQAARLLELVTKDWAAQMSAEIRRESAEANRRQKLLKEREKPEKHKQDPPAPTGALAARIIGAAAMAGVSVDDLTVLSPRNDPYTSWRRRRDAELFAQLFHHFVLPGAKRHLRGLFYRCAMMADTAIWPNGKPLINTHANWVKFQRAAKAARWLGLVAFDQIIDARNDEPKIYVPEIAALEARVSNGSQCEIPQTADDVVPRFSLEGSRGRQTHRIIFYGEKTSLAEVVDPIARQVEGDMVLVTGESSDTRLAEAIARAAGDGRPAALLYFADADPSGHQMAISVARKVQALIDSQYPDLKIKLYRVALTVNQVREWDLPNKPLSLKEKRADKWRAAFGLEQTEIDAALELRPEALRQAILDAIKPFYDHTLDDRVQEAEQAWLDGAAEALQADQDYQDCAERIASAYERVQEAVADLHAEQERAVDILREKLPEPPELPEAAPGVKPTAPQFDSDWDFVTASRRLIADKQLIGSEAIEEGCEEDEP